MSANRFNEYYVSDDEMDDEYRAELDEEEDLMDGEDASEIEMASGDEQVMESVDVTHLSESLSDVVRAALRDGGEGSLPFRIIRTETADEPSSGADAAIASLDADDVVSFLRRLVSSASGGSRTSAARQRGVRPPTLPEFAQPHKAPQEEGVRLIVGGEYGRVKSKVDTRAGRKNIAKHVLSRRSCLRPRPKEDLVNGLVPNTNGTMIIEEDANIYCAQFSADSSFYYTGTQEFKISIYDMSAPPTKPEPSNTSGGQYRRYRGRMYFPPPTQSTLKTIKTIHGAQGSWTMTDTHLSPDGERVIYSSLTPTVYMCTTLDPSETQIPIDFTGRRSRVPALDENEYFRIYSTRFSADGNEIIAGGSNLICVYDLLANKRSVKIRAHEDDVNSCCWADTASGNVLISASDDTTLKVWDRRSLGSSQKPSGVLIGHTEGITYVSAKGDGRYVISNGKDQALRLWDLRKMRSNQDWEAVAGLSYGDLDFDYRYGRLPRTRVPAHPQDCSVMTYRGHSILQTLIRCHFSPAETTGSQYIYSGSYDGRVHIWSLDGRIVQVLDRGRSLPINFDPSAPEPEPTMGEGEHVIVRDVSWHSREPVLFSAAFESARHNSTVARHEWKGLAKTRGALEDYVEKERLEASERRRQRLPGQFEDEDGDDY